MRVIIADFEVFTYYWLLVAKDVNNNKYHIIENNPQELLNLYLNNRDAIWCFYNASYDVNILKAILLGLNPKTMNDHIIKHNGRPWEIDRRVLTEYPIYAYDVKTVRGSLKTLEGFLGSDIRETTVPFDLDRPLTHEETKEVIYYCKHDVDQTFEVLKRTKSDFLTHLNLCRAFDISFNNLNKTKASLTAKILGAKKVTRYDEFNISFHKAINIQHYSHIVEWYKNKISEAQHTDPKAIYAQKYSCEIYGCPTTFAWGGLHGAIPKYHDTGIFLNYDAASYYTTLMVNNQWVSRNMASPDKLSNIYHTRLQLKAAKNPLANTYKICINSAYGSQKDPFSPLYDPLMANNVCVNGQLLILDLVEKCVQTNKCSVVQINTDGVMFKVNSLDDKPYIDAVCRDWEIRTNNTLECEIYNEIHQRDVNTYVAVCEDGSIKRKGDVKNKSDLDYDCPILAEAIINRLVHGIPIKDTINNCNDFRKFQKIYALQGKYTHAYHNGCKYTNKVYRVFASTNPNDTPLYKVYDDKLTKFQSCPEHCFIYNDIVLNKPVPTNVDKMWYIMEASNKLEMWY